MNEREELSRRLLEENGLTQEAVAREGRDSLRSIIEAERQRSAHLRNLTLLSWLVFVVLFVGTIAVLVGARALGAAHDVNIAVGPLLVIAGVPLAGIAFIIAVVMTVSWGLRMAFGPRGVDERLARIEEQLARLESARERPTGEPPVARG